MMEATDEEEDLVSETLQAAEETTEKTPRERSVTEKEKEKEKETEAEAEAETVRPAIITDDEDVVAETSAGMDTDMDTSGMDTSGMDAVIPISSNISSNSNSNSNSSSNLPKKPLKNKMKFKPGDHVIRWEMLPIAWPIQVHGIVLTVSDDAVVLVDFGLAAAPKGLVDTADTADAAAVAAATALAASASASASVEPEATEIDTVTETEADASTSSTTTTKMETVEEDNQELDATGAAAIATATAAATAAKPSISGTSSRMPSIFSSNPREMEQAKKDMERKIMDSLKKFRPSSDNKKHNATKKQRLNVLVLDDPAEINKWKRVNYGGGLFGFGESDDNDDDNDDESDEPSAGGKKSKRKWWNKMKRMGGAGTMEEGRGEDASSVATTTISTDGATEGGPVGTATTTTTTTSNSMKPAAKMAAWWKASKSSSSTGSVHALDDDDVAAAAAAAAASNDGTSSSSSSKKTWWKKLSDGVTKDAAEPVTAAVANMDDVAHQTDTDDVTHIDDGDGAAAATSATTPSLPQTPQEKKNKEEAAQSASPAGKENATDTVSPLSMRSMNPAMARLMSKSVEEDYGGGTAAGADTTTTTPTKKLTGIMGSLFKKKKSSMASSSTGDALDEGVKEADGGTTPTNNNSKGKLDLPKADPPKLVLARTRWLLQHGEDVLPPYHAFHSNSECIAVFCKTGYWSTLQSDVFLHSTAIGNAKTMGAATLGIAASVPLLAPVIAGLGIGLVAAPWLILHSSKKQTDTITQTMTDQFWSQAEPEVFVECIEHWSKLQEYYAKLEERQQQRHTLNTNKPPATDTDTDTAQTILETTNEEVADDGAVPLVANEAKIVSL